MKPVKQKDRVWFYLSPITGCVALYLTLVLSGPWFLTIKGIDCPLLSTQVILVLAFYNSRIHKKFHYWKAKVNIY